MSNIRRAAINSHKHDGLSYEEYTKISEQFDNLSAEELKKELQVIEVHLCKYDSESVFLYRITMILYEFICKRHKNREMEITKQQAKESFKPVTISIVLSTKEEYEGFKNIFLNHAVATLINTSLSSTKNCTDDPVCKIVASNLLKQLKECLS